MEALTLYHYSLVLQPHSDLAERISTIRNEFSTEFGTKAYKLKPQLLLVNFSQALALENKIITTLKAVTSEFPSMKIDLRNFSSIPSHTIYIELASKVVLENMVKVVRQKTQRLLKHSEEHKPHFLTEPKINIATKLLPWQYEKGWLKYSHDSFHGSFIADKMILLRKRSESDFYREIAQFHFLSRVKSKQGELFE